MKRPVIFEEVAKFCLDGILAENDSSQLELELAASDASVV